jgi:hypothetical protein
MMTGTNLGAITIGDGRTGAVIDLQSLLGQAKVFLKLAIEQKEWLAEFRRALFECVFKQVARTFNLFPALKISTISF